MSEYTIPFMGDIWYQVEGTYNTKPSTTSYHISDKIIDVRMETGETVKGLRGITDPAICGYILQPIDYTLHVEWILQPSGVNSLASYCINRSTASDLSSLNFTILNNAFGTTKSYWYAGGAKCKNLKFSSSKGNEWICAADFSCASIVSTSVAPTGKPALFGSSFPFAAFNVAGSINYWGSTDRFYITDSMEVTIENNLKDYWDCDSRTKVAAIPGAIDITGTCDVTIEAGGAAMWGIVTGQTATTTLSSIIITTGLTGADDTWTLSNIRFPDTSIDINVSGDVQMTSQKFTSKTIALT